MDYTFDHALDHRNDGSIRWKQPPGRDDIIGMGTADMDFECAPCIKEALRAVAEENIYHYRFKPEDYYQSVIRWFRDKYGLEIKKEWMSNVPGTIGAIRLALERFSREGDYVLMQSPYFAPLKNTIIGAGRHFLENPMMETNGRFEIDFEDFEEKICINRPSVFLLVNPQNPTGRVFTMEELDRMVEICAKYHVKILSDEVHFLVTYEEHKHIPILAVSETARKIAIQIFSFSKGFNIMSLPHGILLISDREMQEQWMEFLTPYSFGYASNSFAIAAVTAAAGGAADAWLDQVNAYLYENRELFLAEAKRRKLPIRPVRPEAGFLYWIDCRESKIVPELLGEWFMEKAGIRLNNGLDHGEAGRGFVRLNFAVTRAKLLEALDRMEEMFHRFVVHSI